MRIQRKLTLLLILFVMSAVSFSGSYAQNNRQVWALYMGFWAGQTSWDWQSGVLSDRPAIGSYDSRDPGVAGTQIDQAKSAGIDGFVVSWYGLGDGQTTTPTFNNLLDRAGERGFQVGAAIDSFSAEFNNSPDALVNSLNWLVHDRSNHPAYLRYNGKPVIFFMFQGNLGLSAADWQNIRNTVDPDRNTMWIAEGVNGCCIYGGAMDGMYAFNIAWANGGSGQYSAQRQRTINSGGSLYIPTVHPGWDESLVAQRDGRPNPTSTRGRNDGGFLQNSFQGAVASGADVILIGTWNEFVENSHIEPSTNFGSQSLDILRPLIAQWKGGSSASSSVPAAQSNVPEGVPAVQANSRLNVRSGASTENEVLGVIEAGSRWTFIREESGWFVIDFNGREGFISAQFAVRQ
jgi:hypothetical protein